MDFAITGTLTNTTSTGVTRLYRWNNSQGRFVLTQTLADHREGSLAWADFNRDGNPDLLVTGLAPNGQGGQSAITSIYAGTNQSTGYPLTRLDPPSTGLPGTNGGGYIGDFNKDGRADILFVSNGSGGASTRVFQNFSDFWFVEVANTGLTHVGSEPAAAIADFDLDGHQDVVLSGKEGSGSALIRVFRGKGDGTFTNKRTLSPGLWDGALAVGDYDGNGKPDIAAIGREANTNSTSKSLLFRNDHSATTDFQFTAIATSGLVNAYCTGLEFGDVNNDGKPDLILAGFNNTATPNTRVARVYVNKGASANPVFAELDAGSLKLVDRGFAILGDYDKDNDLDLLLGGKTLDKGANQPHDGQTVFYRNTGAPAKANPNPAYSPRILSSWDGTRSSARVTFLGATAGPTPSASVTTNLEITDQTYGDNPLLVPGFITGSRTRVIPGPGNAGTARFFLLNSTYDHQILSAQLNAIDVNGAVSATTVALPTKVFGNTSVSEQTWPYPADLKGYGPMEWVRWGRSVDPETNDRSASNTTYIKQGFCTPAPCAIGTLTGAGSLGFANAATTPQTGSGLKTGIRGRDNVGMIFHPGPGTAYRTLRIFFSTTSAAAEIHVYDHAKGGWIVVPVLPEPTPGGLRMAIVTSAVRAGQTQPHLYCNIFNAAGGGTSTTSVTLHGAAVE